MNLQRSERALIAFSAGWFLCLCWSTSLTKQAFVFGDETGYLLPAIFGNTAENHRRWGGVLMNYPSHLFFYIYSLLEVSNFHSHAKILNCFFIAATSVPAFLIAKRFIPTIWSLAFAIFVVVSPGSSYARYIMPEAMYFFGFWCSVAVFICCRTKSSIIDSVVVGVVVGLLALVKPHAAAIAVAFSITILVSNIGWKSTLKSLLFLAIFAATWRGLAFFFPAGADNAAYSGIFDRSVDIPSLLQSITGHLLAIFAYGGLLIFVTVWMASRRYKDISRLAILATALLVVMAGMTVVFSQAVYGIAPDVEKITRLHGRYYFYALPLFVLVAGSSVAKYPSVVGLFSSWYPLLFFTPLCSCLVYYAYQTSPVDFPDLALIGNRSSVYLATFVMLFQVAIAGAAALAWRDQPVAVAVTTTVSVSIFTALIFTFVAPFKMPYKPLDAAMLNVAVAPMIGRPDGLILGTNAAPGDLLRAMFYLRSMSKGVYTDNLTILDTDIAAEFKWAILLPGIKYVGSRDAVVRDGITVLGPRS